MKAWKKEEIIRTKRGIAVVRTGDEFLSVRFDTVFPDGTVVRRETAQHRGRVPFTLRQQIAELRRQQEAGE